MGKIISIANQNYGVGKTTITFNLSHALSSLNKKILLIDADPQATLTNNFGLISKNIKLNLFDCFTKNINIKDLIIKTNDYC